ncbi:MAG: hypothetical protein WCT46_06160 [Candidatus Gracilibacteria bacterium]|jgi:hypothetical protein
MSGSTPPPIGSGNSRGNADLRVNFDRAHGDWPDHVDMVVPLPGLGTAHKIRVDGNGKIISDELS